MPVHYNDADFERVASKLEGFFDSMEEDLQAVGEIAAEGIVQQTLGGIGENDQPFAPYSPAYQALLDSVGGKARGTVDLRGVFLKDGQTNPKFRSNERRRLSGAGRQAYIEVNAGGKRFTARTKVTRPALGLNDPRSEMSIDLIQIKAGQHQLTLTYNPREQDYMIAHNDGSGRAPKRTWFTLNRTAIQTAMQTSLTKSLAVRVERFNTNGMTGTPLNVSNEELSRIFGIDLI